LRFLTIFHAYIQANIVGSTLGLNKEEMLEMFKTCILKQNLSNSDSVSVLKNLYEIHVREVDLYIEKLCKAFEDKRVLKDSIVILTSDHGDEFGEHGGLSHLDKMYSELIDTPLLIYNTGQTEDCDLLVSNVDVSPTICSFFGAAPADNWEGQSLLPLEDYASKGVFGEAIDMKSKKDGDMSRDIYFYREEDLKIIHRPIENKWEMYDLETDAAEQNNIIESHPKSEDMKTVLLPRIRRWHGAVPSGSEGLTAKPRQGRIFRRKKNC